jgi:type I restriction enzyme, R subunit
MQKEAKARIKINSLLQEAGWRFFDDKNGQANIVLEPKVDLTQKEIDALGNDFEKTKKGFVDFLLLDTNGFPLVVLEAKAEEKSPLDGKEQARRYAKSQHVRFIILSNGNLHYFWDLERGNPQIITSFPTIDSLETFHGYKPNPLRLTEEIVTDEYIALSQYPTYAQDPRWSNEATRQALIKEQSLSFLRPYQVKAVHALQDAARQKHDRYLFEMATGTGKTLVAAAVIKLFLRSGNAKRVLFLVDRIELEDQAHKSFVRYLKNDFRAVIYKENRDEWRKAEIDL